MPTKHKKKEVKPRNTIQFTTLKEFSIETRRNGLTVNADIIRVRTNNPESIAKTNLDRLGLTGKITVTGKAPVYVALTSQEPKYTKLGYFSFVYYKLEDRTKIINYLILSGNVSSRWIAKMMNIGLDARQIGQIRRWNNETWADQIPKI